MVAFLCLGVALSAAEDLRRSGFVGVQVIAVPDDVRAALNLPAELGVRVEALVDGGSAKAAGLQPNDVITQVDDHRVTGVADFVDLVRHLRDGDVSALRVIRAARTLTLSVRIRPKPYETSSDAHVVYDAIHVDGSLRRTIVTAPKLPGRHGAVLYINGIGCYSQESLDGSSNDARLLYALTRAGFVTMRVEKSGMGDSEGPACQSADADFRAELRAYTVGLRALKRYPFVDADAVFLIGVSIGGVEAPLIAADEHVRGIVVINTVARPFFEYLLDSRRRQLRLAQTPADEIDRRMRTDERCNQKLLVEKQRPEAILGALPECADHIAYPAPFTFMQQWADVNLTAAWKAVNRPVLVVYGTSDYVSSIGDDPYLVDLINAFHPGAATLRAIQGMDHTMNRAATMADSFGRREPAVFVPDIIETLSSWLSSTLASRR